MRDLVLGMCLGRLTYYFILALIKMVKSVFIVSFCFKNLRIEPSREFATVEDFSQNFVTKFDTKDHP